MKTSPHSRIFLSSSHAARKGFTLVELLAVMVIIGIVIALVVPAFNNIGKARGLAMAGNQFVNIANFARGNSMARNAQTAIIISTDTSLDDAWRAFAVFECVPAVDGTSGEWKQLGKWELFSEGVVVDPGFWPTDPVSGQTTYPLPVSGGSGSGVPTAPVFPVITKKGSVVTSYRFVVFRANGGLLSSLQDDNPVQVRLVEGIINGTTASYTHPKPGDSSKPANYYDVTLLSATGRPKIDLP